MGKFSKGDLVKLKSGGPNMTVIGLSNLPRLSSGSIEDGDFELIYDVGVVVCAWFDNKGIKEVLKYSDFHSTAGVDATISVERQRCGVNKSALP